MKKFFYKSMLLLFILFCSEQFSSATTVEVEALSIFSSTNPAKNLDVKVKNRVDFENGIVWESGTIVKGQILDVRQPKRGKRNASFKFFPISYTYDGITRINTKDSFVGRYSETDHLDKGKIAASAATTAGGMLLQVPFFSQGVSFTKGVVKNPEGNRFKSGAMQVYKDSPISYIEEGKDIFLQNGDTFYLKFKNDDNEDYPNKSHTLEVDEPKPVNSIQYDFSAVTSPDSILIHTENPDDVLREVEESLR